MLMQATKATEKELLTNNKLLSSTILELHRTIAKLRAKFTEKENKVGTIAMFVCRLSFLWLFVVYP